MEDELYIADSFAKTFETLSPAQQERVAKVIDSLDHGGWKNSQIVSPDGTAGGGLRIVIADDLRVLFRYTPEKHAIVVASVAEIYERQLVSAV
jgi:hypothetical protein